MDPDTDNSITLFLDQWENLNMALALQLLGANNVVNG